MWRRLPPTHYSAGSIAGGDKFYGLGCHHVHSDLTSSTVPLWTMSPTNPRVTFMLSQHFIAWGLTPWPPGSQPHPQTGKINVNKTQKLAELKTQFFPGRLLWFQLEAYCDEAKKLPPKKPSYWQVSYWEQIMSVAFYWITVWVRNKGGDGEVANYGECGCHKWYSFPASHWSQEDGHWPLIGRGCVSSLA